MPQRHKCREELLYSKCRKYHQLVSLDTDIENGDGDIITLAELVADDKAIDLDARLDARRILHALPKRLKQIGYKRYVGFDLDDKQRECLRRYKQKISQMTVAF
jgi:hypothetical protein